MPLNLASPGILIREVDLTIGRIDPVSASVGVLVAPFEKGPVGDPQQIENENDLYKTFGEPKSVDKHYEHWMVASSYLAYGGIMSIVRADDPSLKNAFTGNPGITSCIVKSDDDYNNKGYDENNITDVIFAARNPGSWANGIRVAIIDSYADQILTGINTESIEVGMGITQFANNRVSAGLGTTSILTGYMKGIITGVGGISSELSSGELAVKVISYVSPSGVETQVDYTERGVYYFEEDIPVTVVDEDGSEVGSAGSPTQEFDWFNRQTIDLSTGTKINWGELADRPTTSTYAAERNSRFDEIHVVVIDDTGKITGNAGTILEKHLNLSKAKDALFSVGSPSYWRKYLYFGSQYIFGGDQPVGVTTTGFKPGVATDFDLFEDEDWDQDAKDVIFGAVGSKVYTLQGGKNYDGEEDITSSGALNSSLPGLLSGFQLFENVEKYKVDFLLMGSANYDKEVAQALANQLVSIAEKRKDAVAFISPYRKAFLNDSQVGTAIINSIDTITDNIISFYSPLTSTTYGVFDSGYKYMYDRFNDTFRYIPLNGDIAGTCARNDINQFPWFSPAGTARGTILNAVKLAYNPGKVQRDKLYTNRINPVIFSPGAGIILFGDKTGYGKASAFDRINVRRLFIYLERAIAAAAKDQLFEFNDEITRTNFVNIIEPFLRDVQAKRGIFDYVVICDETNNTPAIIDSNEFVADIYIKPARSINFIGLTFIATRTGVAFEEVIGKV
jgi:hypothetical protein